MDTRVYTIKEVADLLSCSKNHVYRLISSGELTAVNIAAAANASRAKYRVTQADLDRYLESRALQ